MDSRHDEPRSWNPRKATSVGQCVKKVAAALAATSVLAATAGCSTPTTTPPVECTAGRSTLSRLDAHTGTVRWRAVLNQASERPLQVAAGNVVVDAACGASVVALADGDVRFDAATSGEVVGATADTLFTRDDPTADGTSIVSVNLGTGRPAGGYATNLPYRDAALVAGHLIVVAGDQLEAPDGDEGASSWSLQLATDRNPQIVPNGHLVLVTTGDGSTFAVDPASGALAWRTVPPVAATSYRLRLASVPGTVVAAAITNDTSSHAVVYATDSAAGRLRWTRPALSVLAADRDLTVLRTTDAAVGVSTVTGAVRWRHRLPGVDVHATIPDAALTDTAVVVLQAGAGAVGLDRGTGRVLWQASGVTTVLGAGDLVLAQATDRIEGLDAATGRVLWSRPAQRPHQELAVAPDGTAVLLDSDVVPHLGA